jgi:hypothetical protein
MPGGWYIDYYVKGVCKRKKIGSSKQVAELALAQVQAKIAKGKYLGIHEEKKLTFRQVAPEYLAYLGRDAVREGHGTTGFYKWPHRDSNSGFCRERAASLASRRWGLAIRVISGAGIRTPILRSRAACPACWTTPE